MQIIAFALPLYQKLVVPLLLLWFIVAISIIVSQGRRLTKGSLFNPLLILYLFSLLWTFFSTDKSLAFKELEIQLSLLLMPLGFYFIGNYLPDKKRVLHSFVSGVLVAIVLSFIRSVIAYSFNGKVEEFTYGAFTFFMHSSYFSMYIVFALAIVFQSFIDKDGELFKRKLLNYFSVLVLLSGVFASASKTGVIGLALLLVGYIIYYSVRFKKIKSAILLFVGGVALFSSVVAINSSIRNRFFELFEAVQEEPNASVTSTASRMIIWETAVELIKENPIGYGTGMAVPTLTNKYLDKGYHKAFTRKQNAHNQFLQTGLSLGIVGVLLLIWVFIQPFVTIRSSDPLMLVLVLLLALNFITEAALERQAGVVFMAFFYSYFLNYRRYNFER